MTDFRTGCLFLLLLLPIGCAAPPGPSAVYQQALTHNRRGVAAEASGAIARAQTEFTEALRLAGSIENEEGTTVILINLSRVARRQGDFAAAARHLDRAQTLVSADSRYGAEIAFERARLALTAGDTAEAKRQIERAAAVGWTAARLNLYGRILLAQGDVQAAAEKARTALIRAEKDGERVEVGNAHRLLGDALAADGETAAAIDSYRRALAFDKELGVSGKIATDLRALARAATELGDLAAALEYLRRAGEVSRQSNDRPGTILALREMARLRDLQGEPEAASRLKREADRLAAATALP